MDDTSNRRIKSNPRGRKRVRRVRSTLRIKITRKTVGKFLIEHKGSFFTGFLLLSLLVLLFGIAGQMQPPVTNDAPSGETVISYSSFIQDVQAENIVAVTIQGSNINGLLATTSAQTKATVQNTTTTNDTSKNASLDYTAWARTINASNSSWTSPSTNSNALQHTVYTRAPQGGDAQLMSLFISKHVVVSILPVAQTPVWLSVIWKFLPVALLMMFLLIFLASRKSGRGSRSMDDRVTQIGKSRARRFMRAKEVNTTSTANTTDTSNTANAKITSARGRVPLPPTATGSQAVKPVAARVSLEPPVTFNDVAGIEEVRTELEEIVRFLRSPEQFNRLGARIPRGALLVGPPGTGKTLLAKAVAGEANVPFFSMSASEFVEMFVGVGASRVRDLFNQARQVAPAVIFIDEIDAVGRKRSMRVTGNDERDQTLNQLLVELDGFAERQAVVVLAATNRVDILDKALLRPGRFDRRITVSLPDRAGREAILQVHTRKTPLHESVSLTRLARMTTGMSGADLANLVNEAALCAARRNLDAINHECFEDALARVQLGALRPIVMSETERHIIAYHEGGHALVAHHLPEADTVNRVTILPRGQSLGVTQFIAEEDRYNYSRHMLMARIAVGLGGRVAEELTFGADHITTGAENDLQVVTDLARRMVTRWGMSERIGVVFADYRAGEAEMSLNMQRVDPETLPGRTAALVVDAEGRLVQNGHAAHAHDYAFAASMPAARSANGSSMSALIDTEVQSILHEGREMARAILCEHTNQLSLLADKLMECEQLDRTQFEALFV